VLDNLNLFSYG